MCSVHRGARVAGLVVVMMTMIDLVHCWTKPPSSLTRVLKPPSMSSSSVAATAVLNAHSFGRSSTSQLTMSMTPGEGSVGESKGENTTSVDSASAFNGGVVDDLDLPSFNEIDFEEMNPFNGLMFEDYERRFVYNTDGKTPQEELEWDESVPTLNQIYLVGRVGNAPEARYLDDNNVVVSLSLALPRYYNYWERRDLGIEYGKEETEWYNLEVWGQTGEFVAKNVQKGMRVGIIGAIDTDFYPNKQTGMLSSNCKILVQDFDILESKMESDARRENQEQRRGPSLYANDDDDGYDTFNPMRDNSGGFFDPS